MEVRHSEWFSDHQIREEFFIRLKRLKMGAVITDTAGRRDCLHMHLTTAQAFIRFVGNGLHPTDYTRIDEWVRRIKLWLNNGLHEIYFFVHMHEAAKVPDLIIYLIDKLNNLCGMNLKMPAVISDNSESSFRM